MEKHDCFAHESEGCRVLTELVCGTGECPFYKTKAQKKLQEQQGEERIKRIYGTTMKKFLELKRRVNDA